MEALDHDYEEFKRDYEGGVKKSMEGVQNFRVYSYALSADKKESRDVVGPCIA